MVFQSSLSVTEDENLLTMVMEDSPSNLDVDFAMLDEILAGDERIELSHAGGELQDVEEELETLVSGIRR